MSWKRYVPFPWASWLMVAAVPQLGGLISVSPMRHVFATSYLSLMPLLVVPGGAYLSYSPCLREFPFLCCSPTIGRMGLIAKWSWRRMPAARSCTAQSGSKAPLSLHCLALMTQSMCCGLPLMPLGRRQVCLGADHQHAVPTVPKPVAAN